MVLNTPPEVPFQGLLIRGSAKLRSDTFAADGAARSFPFKEGVGQKPTVSKAAVENP